MKQPPFQNVNSLKVYAKQGLRDYRQMALMPTKFIG